MYFHNHLNKQVQQLILPCCLIDNKIGLYKKRNSNKPICAESRWSPSSIEVSLVAWMVQERAIKVRVFQKIFGRVEPLV